MSTNIPNKTTALALNTKAIEGVDKHFAKVKTLTVAGVTITPAALKAVFQAESDANKALDESEAQRIKQLAATRAARAKARVMRAKLKKYILGSYGTEAVDMLVDFGMKPPKLPTRRTVDSKAQAVDKSRATREARHTMSKKAKLAIKGTPEQAAQAETPAPAVSAPKAETPSVAATGAAGSTPSHS